jgi:hypothetical protein
VADLALV